MKTRGDRAGNRAAPARLAAALAVALALAALIGWKYGIPTLASVLPGSVQMKANTASGLILSGIALFIVSTRPSAGMRALNWILCGTVFLMGMGTVAEYVMGRTFGIDELLFVDNGGAYDVFRGRMSPFTAAAFMVISMALIALPYPRFRELAKLGAAFSILLGATVLLCYLWDADELITDRWLPPVAINTAAGVALLGCGILLAPNEQGNGLNQQIGALAGMEVRILTAFSVALGLLMIGGTYTYRTTVQFADSVEWVAHSQEVRAAVASLYGSLAGSEVALRDYLLTKDDNNLAEHRRLCSDVLRHLDDVQRLTADNPIQQRNVAALRPIVMGRLDAMGAALRAFADFGLTAARAVIEVTRRTNATQSVRAQTDILDAEEVRLLGLRQRATADVRSGTLLSLLATLALASALFIALFRGVHREVRARREAEDAVRTSDRYSRSVLDSSPDCLCVLTLEGRISQMTSQGRRLMDIDESAAIEHQRWLDGWSGDDRVAAGNALDAARAGAAARFQGFCPTVKGSPKWWDVIVMPILAEDGRPERLLTVARDISEVKRTESELRETNRFLDSLIDNLPVMVVIKDAADLRIVRHNGAFARLTGFTPDALLGKSAGELFTADEARLVDAKDREALETGSLVEVPELVLHTATLGVRTFHSMTVPVNDRTGRPKYLMTISVDVTARKLAEQAIQELNTALEAKARQLESSVQELESFSYSVSHDLRAPLRAIDGFALMIEEDYSDSLDAEGRRYLSVIRGNSRRMGALIDDLLSFSRLGRLPVAAHEVNVESLVREVVDEIVNGRSVHHEPTMQISPQIEIEIEALPPARGDRELLRQVWLNLIANAVKYSSKTEAPRIKVSGRQNGVENLYSVRDNGVGFDMNYADKLFGVFQRLHRTEEFSGTGVGLAIVHRVISRHGGRVWAEGRINDGATFSFALPKGGT